MTSPTDLYSFSFNGIVFGGASSVHQLLSADGFGLPDLRTQDDNRGYADGMFSGRDFYSGRVLTVTLLTLAGNGNTAQQNFAQLTAAVLPQQSGVSTLQFQLSATDSLKRIGARVRKRSNPITVDYTLGYIQSTWQFFCPDPRFYDDTLQSGTIAPVTVGGRTYNLTFNRVFPTGTATNAVAVVNAGNVTTYPTYTVNGPVSNPIFGNATSGASLQLNYTMTGTDVIVIDLLNRLITLNGNPARNLLIGGSTWFGADPGTSSFYFNGANTSLGQTQALVAWRNAYV